MKINYKMEYDIAKPKSSCVFCDNRMECESYIHWLTHPRCGYAMRFRCKHFVQCPMPKEIYFSKIDLSKYF